MTNADEEDIQGSFDKTLRKSDLKDIAIDVSDASIDTFMKGGLLRELPIIRILVSLAQTGANIHDRLFLKKIASFLYGIKDVDTAERQAMIDEIDNSQKYRLKVGEKLLYLIDSCKDYESSELVSMLFSAYLQGTITYSDFVECAEITADMSIENIRNFIESYHAFMHVEDVGFLMHTGLMTLSYEGIDVNVEKEDDNDVLMDGGLPYKAQVDGGELWANPTHAGEIIYKTFKDRV